MTSVPMRLEEPRQALAETEIVLGVLRASDADHFVTEATRLANALAKIIEDRKLYRDIKGNRFVFVDAWTALAAMLGVTPYEEAVVKHEDGTYVATVQLRRASDGYVIGRASAECGGPDEDERSEWHKRSGNARRSMALTRATGKACRLAFSWIVVLAGFQPTPAEEVGGGEGAGSDATAGASPKQIEFLRSLLESEVFTLAERDHTLGKIGRLSREGASRAIQWAQRIIAQRSEAATQQIPPMKEGKRKTDPKVTELPAETNAKIAKGVADHALLEVGLSEQEFGALVAEFNDGDPNLGSASTATIVAIGQAISARYGTHE